MNQRGMVLFFVNFIGVVLGAAPVLAGLRHSNELAWTTINTKFGITVLALLFIFNAYCYVASGSRAVGKHFARHWLVYVFFGGFATVLAVLFSVGSYGLTIGDLELLVILVATAVGCYALGVYHQINAADEKIAQLLKNAHSSEEVVRGLIYGKLDRS